MGVKIQTIKDIRLHLARELNGIYNEPEIRVLSDILIKTVLCLTKLHELHDKEYPVTEAEAEKILQFTGELKTHKPIQYILGETTFYNCKIKLGPSTLIPRPETEELVDLIIRENKDLRGNIFDFGTGSGCIAIALAANLPSSKLFGVDISEDALKIAVENADLNNVNIAFIKADILNLQYQSFEKASVIVSNPPYVRNSEKSYMAKNVIDYEPHQALFIDDSDPLIYYKAILNIADNLFLPGGKIYFEMNEKMGNLLVDLLSSYNYTEIIIVSDINDRERIIKGRKSV